MQKHGLENFSKIILESGIETKKEVDKREIYWIAEYKKIGKAEYNISVGGTGGNLGEEWRKRNSESHWKTNSEIIKKLSESHKGQVAWNKGLKNIYSEETRRKIGEKNKGKSYRKGKKMSESAKLKISLANKGKKRTDEQKRILSEKLKGKNIGSHKNMTWKVIDGKRVWIDKEIENA